MGLYGDFLAANQHLPLFKWEHYFPIYESHLSKYVNSEVTIFEVGVLGGGSLQMWKQYLGPRATVVGIDIDPQCKTYENGSIRVEIGNQSDTEFLDLVLSKYGTPDIVIDDGSHINSDIMTTLTHLLKLMPKNSTYLIEDCHALFHKAWEGNKESAGTLFDWIRLQMNKMHEHYLPDVVKEQKTDSVPIGIHVYDSVVVLDVGSQSSFKALQTALPITPEVLQTLTPLDFH